MLARCRNSNLDTFSRYGGRGIAVCDQWVNSFENFLRDMGERPPGMSLDRINNQGRYEKANCRWALPTQQNRNKRSNRFVLFNGQSVLLKELAEMTGVDYRRLYKRIVERGWSAEDAVSLPPDRRKVRHLYRGTDAAA